MEIRYISNGKVIAEFTNIQAAHDFIIERTQRQCDANYILSQRGRDKEIKRNWFFIGIFTGTVLIMIVSYILGYCIN